MSSQLAKYLVVKLALVARRHADNQRRVLQSLQEQLSLAKSILTRLRAQHAVNDEQYAAYNQKITLLKKMIEEKEKAL